LQQGELERALALHDQHIIVHCGRDYRDVANASTLLWRLEREGLNLGTRWQRLAELARERIGDHGLAFADAHYALALTSAGELSDAQRFVTSMQLTAEQHHGFYANVARDIGVPLVQAILALGAGSGAAAVAKLMPIAQNFQRLGGSNAQRDIFNHVLIEAALQSDHQLARELLEQRLSLRPNNRYAREHLRSVRASSVAA
jgi:hypothetical protein